ncbi:hypothetical protein R4Z10_15010 [Niallia sp. XMNu-256]|uniref:YphA family membrane protein n=1 Tax=Niallia sp. XMNu-256 TaxID=3082444 RepID=UPI0030CF60F4
MNGLLFYWIFWMGWVITTFFYSKNHHDRLILSAWILVSIMLSTSSVLVGSLEISGSGLFMLLTTYLTISRLDLKPLLYVLFSVFILMLVTACFHLYELFDPVWLMMKREWLLAIILTCTTLLLIQDKRLRMIAVTMGSIHGEILYSLLVAKYSFSYPVATLYSLDPYALSISFLVGWNGLELVASYFDKQVDSIEKEKQKLS